jgi:hypothetical protein
MAKRRKRCVPIMLLWSKAEQRRFSDAVERLIALVNDLAYLLEEHRRRRRRTTQPREGPSNVC